VKYISKGVKNISTADKNISVRHEDACCGAVFFAWEGTWGGASYLASGD